MLRRFLRTLAATLSFTLPLQAAQRPNIIFFFVDDLGYGDIGCFWQDQRSSSKKFDTPGLDKMAAEGAKLTHHYISASVCAPSRASFLQGRHQGHCDVRNSQFDKALPETHTIASVLRESGYRTIHIGKNGVAGGEGSTNLSGNGSQNLAAHPLDRGFDRFFGYLFHGDGHEHFPRNGSSDKTAHIYDDYRQVKDASADLYTTDAWTAAAKQEIINEATDGDDQPFFLYLAYDTPHFKMQRPSVAYPTIDSDGDPLTGGIQWTTAKDGSGMVRYASTADGTGSIDAYTHPDIPSSWANNEKQHVGMIRRIDNSIADILQTLKDLDLDDNTLCIFSSDNGPHNEGNNPRTFESYANMEGIKRDMWEAGIRVPTIVRWPGNIAGATGSEANIHENSYPSAIWDWMPTFCDLAGVTAPGWCDGVSIVPSLTGIGTQRDKGYLYFEFQASGSTPNWSQFPNHRSQTKGQMQCLRIGDHMGIRTAISSGSEPFEIYQVTTDPGQATNLATRLPELQAEMQYRALASRRKGAGVSRPYDSIQIPAVAPEVTTPGIAWASFSDSEAAWAWVPEFRDMTPADSGISATIDLSVRPADDHFGLAYNGLIEVPTAGAYTFYLEADTGADLWIHDGHVIADDYPHTGSASSDSVYLEAGLHPIRLYYRHSTGARSLGLEWSGPGISRQTVPPSALSVATTDPLANDDLATTIQNQSTLIDVLANDLDDGTPEPLSIESLTEPDFGSAEIEAGQVRYTPPTDFLGTATFSYTITDGQETDSATVTVTVIAATPPTAVDDEATTFRNLDLLVDVLANDLDDGFPEPLFIESVTAPDHGSAEVESGKIRYTPPTGFTGTATFSYSASDGDASDSATVTVAVLINTPPQAQPDQAYAASGGEVIIDVLANDLDDGFPAPLSITEVSSATFGNASIQGNAIRYAAPGSFRGTDSFTYTISDGSGSTSTASVVVVITPFDEWWFPFDESDGSTASDATGKTATLTNPGATQWVSGKFANAISFPGSGFVTIPDYKGILGANDRSVTAWIKPTDTGAMPVFGWGPNASGAKWTVLLQNNHLRLEATSGYLEGSSSITNDQWHHIAVTFENDGSPDVTDAKLYIDGQLETSFASERSRTLNTTASLDVRIGADVQDRTFTGLIDEARIHDRALSQAEILSLIAATDLSQDQSLWYYQNYADDSPSPSDWELDDDHDGFSVFLEYALGGSPHFRDSEIAPFLGGPVSDLEFVFNRRRSGLSPSDYVSQTSETMLADSWSPLPLSSFAPHPELPDYDQVRVAVPSDATKRFVRLQVTP